MCIIVFAAITRVYRATKQWQLNGYQNLFVRGYVLFLHVRSTASFPLVCPLPKPSKQYEIGRANTSLRPSNVILTLDSPPMLPTEGYPADVLALLTVTPPSAMALRFVLTSKGVGVVHTGPPRQTG